jgi:hypothetical protein
MLALLAVGAVLLATKAGSPTVRYWVGMTVLLSWLFQLIAFVLGIIGLFEGAPHRRRALSAILISTVFFAVFLVFAITGMHHSHPSHGG